MKSRSIFFIVLILACGAEPEPDPVPGPIAAPDPDPDPEHYRGQKNNPRQQEPQNYQDYPPPPPPYNQNQQPNFYGQQPNPYGQQPNAYQGPLPPYYPHYPYAPPPPIQQQPQQQQPPRRGRVLAGPSNQNSVAPPPAPNLLNTPIENQNGNSVNNNANSGSSQGNQDKKYNKRYPLTPPLLKFKIGVISDLDEKSKVEGGEDEEYKELFRDGYLSLQQQNSDEPDQPAQITVEWNETAREIKSGFGFGGRGFELSTLNVFNGKIYTCDDKTGIVFELNISTNESEPIVPIPWTILPDGNSTGSEGFKCEWATLKDGDLWIGGHGHNTLNKEGGVKDKNQKFVKRISSEGQVMTEDWDKNYEKIAEALEISEPGYVTHEAVAWSDELQKWFFMPKKISKEAYNPESDAEAGSDSVLIADEDFGDIQVGHIGEITPNRGFSGMKFIPGTGDQMIVAMKTSPGEQGIETYIMAFDLKGNVLLNETKFANEKYQGIEFL